VRPVPGGSRHFFPERAGPWGPKLISTGKGPREETPPGFSFKRIGKGRYWFHNLSEKGSPRGDEALPTGEDPNGYGLKAFS